MTGFSTQFLACTYFDFAFVYLRLGLKSSRESIIAQLWPMTVLDSLIQSFNRAGEFNRDDQVAPAVILWPDKERQWEPVLLVLREWMPHLLTLGPYAANCKTGPAIWLRCMIAQTLPEANWKPTCSANARTSSGAKIVARTLPAPPRQAGRPAHSGARSATTTVT